MIQLLKIHLCKHLLTDCEKTLILELEVPLSHEKSDLSVINTALVSPHPNFYLLELLWSQPVRNN